MLARNACTACGGGGEQAHPNGCRTRTKESREGDEIPSNVCVSATQALSRESSTAAPVGHGMRIHAFRGGWRRLRALAGAAEAIAGGGSAWHRSCDDNKHFACIWPQRASIFARFGGFKKRPLGFSVLLQKKFKTVFPFNLSLCMDESSE
jgi:hypothetical protein